MQNSGETYTLFFDGCSKGNPGLAGAGAVLYKNQIEIYAQSSFVGTKESNNLAEYHGLLLGLEYFASMFNNCATMSLHIKGDSMLVIKHMKGEYKVSSPRLKPLYVRAKELEKSIGKVSYEHIYRENNKRADELANQGLLMMENNL